MFAGRRCYHVDHLETVLREFDVHMAILASRPEGLQTLVDRVCAAGVHAILNFVPKRVNVPGGCSRRGDATSRPSSRCSRSWPAARRGPDAEVGVVAAPGEPAEGMTA